MGLGQIASDWVKETAAKVVEAWKQLPVVGNRGEDQVVLVSGPGAPAMPVARAADPDAPGLLEPAPEATAPTAPAAAAAPPPSANPKPQTVKQVIEDPNLPKLDAKAQQKNFSAWVVANQAELRNRFDSIKKSNSTYLRHESDNPSGFAAPSVESVQEWQAVLIAGGYLQIKDSAALAEVKAGQYGAKTRAATAKLQSETAIKIEKADNSSDVVVSTVARSTQGAAAVKVDNIVGPITLATAERKIVDELVVADPATSREGSETGVRSRVLFDENLAQPKAIAQGIEKKDQQEFVKTVNAAGGVQITMEQVNAAGGSGAETIATSPNSSEAEPAVRDIPAVDASKLGLKEGEKSMAEVFSQREQLLAINDAFIAEAKEAGAINGDKIKEQKTNGSLLENLFVATVVGENMRISVRPPGGETNLTAKQVSEQQKKLATALRSALADPDTFTGADIGSVEEVTTDAPDDPNQVFYYFTLAPKTKASASVSRAA